MSELSVIPPLRQSGVETAACPRCYVEIHIKGRSQPDSIPSERGQEIHKVMSQYVDHCSKYRIASDWNYFNQLTVAAGPVAGPILDGVRDVYRVNWQEVYGTEVTLELDEIFNPRGDKGLFYMIPAIEHGKEIERVAVNLRSAAYTAILDVIELSEDGRRAAILDYKSHPSVFEADTHQSVQYPFMLFKHLPTLEEVEFRLIFVRYQNCTRSVVWKRSDMPEMQDVLSRARQRQIITHQNPEDAKAYPGKVCAYCPLGKNFACPIAEWNEYTLLSPEDRLRWKIWMAQMNKINNAALKAHAEVHEKVSCVDGNGRTSTYHHIAKPTTVIRLTWALLEKLDSFTQASGEQWSDWKLALKSTGLMSKLNANKKKPARGVLLDQLLEEGDIDGSQLKNKWVITTIGEGDEADYNPFEEEE